MSAPQQTGAMQAATLRCPPNVFRERYTFADFEVTHTYGEGPNWSVCAARCKWSSAQVVLQTYTEVGNLSGCMALALTAAHGLTNHPSFLPLYAVFRDVTAAGPPADSKGSGAGAASTSGNGGDSGGSGAARGDRIVMVYPGGPAQHPLDARSPGSSASSPPGSSGGGGGSGPPVSERGVVRGLLQPLNDLVAVLGSMGLRPPYVCGLDVWMDSPEAPGPGQALFMVPLLCHRWGQSPPEELLPAAVPYAAPYLRGCPSAAKEQEGTDEAQAKRWLSWSAAALVHCVLIGSPPPDKARKTRSKLPSAAAVMMTSAASVPQLPPLPSSNSAPTPRGSMLMTPLGSQRPNGLLMPLHGGQNGASGSSEAAKGSLAATSSVNGAVAKRSSGSRVADSMPLWLSDEAGDWFRRGLVPDCSSRAPLDEQMRHPWVSRHAVPRNISNGHTLKRESLGSLPRELHPLMLDVVPMGLTRPGREEVENLMAEMAACEAPSTARPALPWQVMEGPQGAVPTAFVEEFTEEAAPDLEDADERDMGVVERYEVAEEQKDDGTRVVEELRVVSGKPDGSLNRAAKALQAAMARRVEAGQWVMANPRGTTFDDIARQNQQRSQVAPALPVPQRRVSNGAPAPPTSLAPRVRSPDPIPAPVATAGARTSNTSVSTTASSGPVGRNKSPGTRGSRASISGPKAGRAAK